MTETEIVELFGTTAGAVNTGTKAILKEKALHDYEVCKCIRPVSYTHLTFLNAMTYPDKTLYPVASCNDKDFANLMHVYMDAVFYPAIYREPRIFYQEGWHYEMEDKSDELKINGVVYNAVSYTHLDVYKRQVLYRFIGG